VKILFIHGIKNEENSEENIKKTWSKALKESLVNVGVNLAGTDNFEAAFYGDVLFDELNSWDNENSATPMSTDSPDEDYADDDVAALYLEIQKKYEITDDTVRLYLDAVDDAQSATRMAKGVHKKWLKAIARALEDLFADKGKGLAKYLIPQAATYLHKPGVKEKVDALVQEQVFDSIVDGEEVIVISHSLGTVVAYDLLRQLRHKVKVKKFFTFGSPLSIEVVKERLGSPLICLANVEKWINVADDEDFVALEPKLDGDTFGCNQIENILVDNGDEDAHSIETYLSHEVVARAF